MWSTFPSFPNFFVLLLAKFVFVSPTVRPESISLEMYALVNLPSLRISILSLLSALLMSVSVYGSNH